MSSLKKNELKNVNIHQLFVLCTANQIIGGDFTNFCGLLRTYEFYTKSTVYKTGLRTEKHSSRDGLHVAESSLIALEGQIYTVLCTGSILSAIRTFESCKVMVWCRENYKNLSDQIKLLSWKSLFLVCDESIEEYIECPGIMEYAL